jgi:hypothetical protein
MAITSEYFNENNDEITLEQARRLTKYRVMVYEGDRKLRYETHTNGLKSHTSYYINSDVEIQEILSTEPNASFAIESKLGEYRISDNRSYRDRILTNWRIYAEDTSMNEIICMQIIDPLTGSVIHNRTEKSYFDANGTEIYVFSYNADGSCFFIEKVQEYQTDFYAKNIGNDPDLTFTWQGFEYYEYSEPVVPKDVV